MTEARRWPGRAGQQPAGARKPRDCMDPAAGVVTRRRPARADDFHSAPDLFRPTGLNLRTLGSPGSVPVSLVTSLIGIKRKSIDLVIDEN